MTSPQTSPSRRDNDHHDEFGGLGRDLPRLVGRRRALQVLGGIGLGGLVAACGSGSSDAAGTSSTTSTTAASNGAVSTSSTVAAGAGAEVPDETAGPFPADGSNGPNLLTDGAVVRSDITTSIGDFSGTADGVPMTVQLTIVDAATGSPRSGAALYLWHCTADGRYSIYEVEDENYLRGVQEADGAGKLTFATVFPGCYPGRWPHFHFEVYDSLGEADAGSRAVKTSQIALPESDCQEAYADSRYGSSSANLDRLSLDSDGIFADGWSDQLATVAGSPDEGYTASLLVRI